MSLIDEALKRARQEAARQDSAQAEGRFARVPVYAPPSRSSRPWLLPVVLAGCLAVGVGVGVILSRRGEAPVAQQPAVAEQRVEPRLPRTVTDVPRTITDPPRIVEETPVPVAPRAEAPAPPVLRPEPVQEEASPAAPVPTTPAPTPAPPAAGPEISLPATPPASTYDREVPLPDGGTLRLNGIAFSGQPVALFGDKVVAPGESINGFTVIEIEQKRVKLQGRDGATVYVTLR